jgi:hypothetical protein
LAPEDLEDDFFAGGLEREEPVLPVLLPEPRVEVRDAMPTRLSANRAHPGSPTAAAGAVSRDPRRPEGGREPV